jgi:tRNA threonylcarbamoyladenosine biosynthesis protein TsaE
MITAIQQLIPSGEWTTSNAQETFDLGVRIGERLSGGEIILLDGPLGAGKTVLVKGIARSLGLNDADVTSPSFTLVNLYRGQLLLYHIDLYRLDEGAAAAHAVDLDEILTDESAVVIIEWGERLGRYPLPAGVARVRISGDGDEPRKIAVLSGTDVSL